MSENQSENEGFSFDMDSGDDEGDENLADMESSDNLPRRIRRDIRSLLASNRIEFMRRRIFGRSVRSDEEEATTSEEMEASASESNSQNARPFDTDLPAEHSYLGNLDRVTGVDYLEPGQYYKLLVLTAHSLVFPGETMPMILPWNIFGTSEFLNERGSDGWLFGIVFPDMSYDSGIFGVTCQIYEKGYDARGGLTIKSRACQRFIIKRSKNPNLFPDICLPTRRKLIAVIEILPEVVLPDPLIGKDTNSYAKFRMNGKMKEKLRQMESGCMPWPKFVYDQYDVSRTLAKISDFLSSLHIHSMPTDPVSLSFWCGKNVLLDSHDRFKIFITDSVTKRMMIIGKSLEYTRYFVCRRCKSKLANYNSLFAMSKQGIQSNYCNPSGIIFETNTIYSAIPDSIYLTGDPSTEFTWFPGYAWRMAQCNSCDSHLGWKFSSTKSSLTPKSFYGLTGNSVLIETAHKKMSGDTPRSCPFVNSMNVWSSDNNTETDEGGQDESA